MKRKSYWKGYWYVIVVFIGMGILAIFTSEGASPAVKVIMPTVMFLIGLGVFANGFKYPKE